MTDFRFEVGKRYARQDGEIITIIAERSERGYECVQGSDTSDHSGEGIWRYNRPGDMGRVTGTDFNFSDPRNLIIGEVDQDPNDPSLYDLEPFVEDDLFPHASVCKGWDDTEKRREIRAWLIRQYGPHNKRVDENGKAWVSKGTRWVYSQFVSARDREFKFRYPQDAFEFKMRWG